MAVTKRTRYEVLRRDNHTCRYCGGAAPDVVLTVDHVVPTALGGSDEPSNLVTACRDCNAGKSSMQPDHELVENVSDDALRWAAAMERAAEVVADETAARDALFDGFKGIWLRATYESRGKTYYLNGGLPLGWQNSLDQIHRAGLPISEIEDGARVVDGLRWSPNDPFAYLMGVLRTKLDRQIAVARSLLDTETAE